MDVFKVIKSALLSDTPPEGFEAQLDVIPVVQGSIRYNGAVYGEEVDTILMSAYSHLGRDECNILVGD